jgi:hypothetical protein
MEKGKLNLIIDALMFILLDGDDKEYGYVIEYKDLFKCLEGARSRTTSVAPWTAAIRTTWRGYWRTGSVRPESTWKRPEKPSRRSVSRWKPPETGGLPALLLRPRF